MKRFYTLLVALLAIASSAKAWDYSMNGHEFVDLGLPSGTLWATCNIGANSPEDYGYYFSWGETAPKTEYDWNTYKYCKGSASTLTKYCTNSEYGYNGFTDNLVELLPEDDAATANWGDGWQMPSTEQVRELLDDNNTEKRVAEINGWKGLLITSKRFNTEQLFLPFGGWVTGRYRSEAGEGGNYWSRSLDTLDPLPKYANYLMTHPTPCFYIEDRRTGYNVRPVCSTPPIEPWVEFTASDSTMYFHYDNQWQSCNGNWDKVWTNGEYQNAWLRAGGIGEKVKRIVIDASFANVRFNSLRLWFSYMTNLESITGLSYLNTSGVTNMEGMFYECPSLTSLDLSGFNTTDVMEMSSMFKGCSNLETIYIGSGWSTENVLKSEDMFLGCTKITGMQGTTYNELALDKTYARIDEGETNPGYLSFIPIVFEENGIYYKTTNINTVEVTYKNTNYNTYSGNVVIPATVSYDGATYSVTAIGNRAFKNCSGLTGVTIGSNVLAIGDEAFRNCGEHLTKVVIPDQVTTIGYAAFMECQRLWEVHIGSGVTFIDNRALALNDALELVICTALIPPVTDDSFTDYDYPWVYVPDGALPAYKNSVYEWHLFAKLYTQYAHDFAQDGICYQIQPDSSSVYVVRKYDRLNDELYPYTEASYDIPETVSFEGTTYSVTGIDAFAFKECTNLKRISLPSTLQVIWNGAFAGDENIEAIYCYATTPPTISFDETLALVDPFEGYTMDAAKLFIHGSAFDAYMADPSWHYFCELRNVDGYDFEKDGIYYKIQPDGTSVYVTNAYNPETDTYDFNYSGGEDYIPETVTFDGTTYTVTGIAAQAFWKDTKLTSIALPKTIQAIEACTFNCSYLESIVCHAMTPPVLSAFAFGFEEEAFNGCIFVPGFAYSSYEDADVWQNFNRDVLQYQFEVDGLYYYSANEGEVSLTMKDDFFYSGNYVGTINIPETVTYQGTTYTVVDIDGSTFKGSVNLTEVTIPATVTLIGNKVFQGCTNLTIVNCNATTPPELRFNSFDESHYQNVTLNVPEGTKSLYQAADYWKNFLNIVAPVDPNAPIDYAGTIWQEYTSAEGELSEANETGLTVSIAPSAETPGTVDIGYPALTMAGSNQKLYGFTVDGVNRCEFADGTIYYTLTEPKIMQIRGRTSTLLCNATLVGVQSSLDSTPALKLILTGRRTQFEDIVWFGSGDMNLNQEKALIDDFITGVPSMEDGRSKTEGGSIFNLAGQRLSKMQKGINIVDGKKVLR